MNGLTGTRVPMNGYRNMTKHTSDAFEAGAMAATAAAVGTQEYLLG